MKALSSISFSGKFTGLQTYDLSEHAAKIPGGISTEALDSLVAQARDSFQVNINSESSNHPAEILVTGDDSKRVASADKFIWDALQNKNIRFTYKQ